MRCFRRLIPGLALLAALALAAAGCDQVDPALSNPASQSTACTAHEAIIMVGEGFIKDLCGCSEGTPQNVQNQSLSCTVPLGTVIFFSFLGIASTHQIVSTGVPSFVSSPPVTPETTDAWSVQPSATGTYTYADSFEPGVIGAIIVQ